MNDEAKMNLIRRAPLACYANYFEVGHNPYEFLLDFGQFQPEVSEVLIHTRIMLCPAHARMFAEILTNAVAKYETENGPIAEVAAMSKTLSE